MSDAPIGTLPGIGTVTTSWLEEAGIQTMGDLRSLGALEAYRRLKFMFPRRVSLNALNALYGLEAALRGCGWLAAGACEDGAPAGGQGHRRRPAQGRAFPLHHRLNLLNETECP